jgi:outer membrane protein assembly factor BamA
VWHALVCAAVFGLAAPDAAVVHIGRIQIDSNDVFSPDEAAKGWFYRAANAIHIQTRVSFLRKQLLFAEGDALDIARLAETERNLRALPFIKSASVTASAPHDGVSDVLVVTQDAWTTEPGGSFGSKGGTTTYSVEFTETDLLGTGRQISFAYDQGTERTSRLISFQDPYLFRPFWRGRFLLADNSDGRQREFEVARPFYAFSTPWAADALVSRTAEEDKLYQFGETISAFHHQNNESLLSYGRALDSSEFQADRATIGIDFTEDSFSEVPGKPAPIVPADRKFRYVFGTFEHIENSFETLNYVNRDSRYEDFNLAPRIFAKVGYSSIALGAPSNSLFGEAEWSGGVRFSDDAFAQADVDLQSRFDGGPQNTIVSAFLGYARRFRLVSMPQTFVARGQYDQGWHLDQEVQFEASGLTGLRGYALHAMEGDKRLIMNFEQRFFSEREYLQLISPGAVVFFDIGTALPRGVPFAVDRLRSDAGVGLRFAIGRAGGNNVLRIDVAYPFQRDPTGRRGALVSFSSSQAFPFHRTGPLGQ